MKKFLLFLSLFAISATLVAQKDPRVLDFDGLDQFKLGMKKADVEKLIGKKIVFKHIGIDEMYSEMLSVTYKGIPFELMMMRAHEGVDRLENVSTTSPAYKTPEGIGIGSNPQTIIDTYEKHLLIITKDEITLANIDDIRSSIVFTLKNNKVVQITVAPTAQFRDRE